jgi:predicted Zn-ribbon and HTH transcriptional regulator
MFRKDLIELLLDHPLSVNDVARLLDEPPNRVADDMYHLRKSLKSSPYREVITPAECKKCGFVFPKDKLRKPGKCPLCRGTWISEPLLGIQQR